MKLGTIVIALISGNIRVGVVTALTIRLVLAKESTTYTVTHLDVHGSSEESSIKEEEMCPIVEDNSDDQAKFVRDRANYGWAQARAAQCTTKEEDIPF